jgi:hypothetical protein
LTHVTIKHTFVRGIRKTSPNCSSANELAPPKGKAAKMSAKLPSMVLLYCLRFQTVQATSHADRSH